VRRKSDACPCRGLNPVAVAFDVRARRGKVDRLLLARSPVSDPCRGINTCPGQSII
jgi:hypothetical protein